MLLENLIVKTGNNLSLIMIRNISYLFVQSVCIPQSPDMERFLNLQTAAEHKKFTICWLFRLQSANRNVREVAMGQRAGQMLICELFMLSFCLAVFLFCWPRNSPNVLLVLVLPDARCSLPVARINCCRF